METRIGELKGIYQELRQKIAAYAPPFQVRVDSEWRYELWSEKDLMIEGRKRKEVYFAGLIIQKDYVGFYYMPVYTDPHLADVFEPGLLKLRKGKSCFHIRKLDDDLLEQVEKALEKGFRLYQERGWV